MISIRAAIFVTGFLGAFFALLSSFSHSGADSVVAGMVVAAASVIGWGFCDWIEER